MRYSTSKFEDFSWNFFEFYKDFSYFEHFYENATVIFKLKIYRNAPLINRNFLSQKFTEMPLCTISIKDYDFSKLKS